MPEKCFFIQEYQKGRESKTHIVKDIINDPLILIPKKFKNLV
jgi:hypothetical protein